MVEDFRKLGSFNIDRIVELVKANAREKKITQDMEAILEDRVYMARLYETLVKKRRYDSDNLTAEQAREVADELYMTINMAGGFERTKRKGEVENLINKIRDSE